MTRKREQDIDFYPAGIPLITVDGVNKKLLRLQYPDPRSQRRLGGRAGVLNFPGIYPNTVERVNNRDQVYFQSDYPFRPHSSACFLSAMKMSVERKNR